MAKLKLTKKMFILSKRSFEETKFIQKGGGRMTPEYMSLTDAAKYLGYGSKHVVYDLIKAGMPVI